MTGEIIPPNLGGITTTTATEIGGKFALLASPAMPTFEALHAMASAFRRLETVNGCLDRKEAQKHRDAAGTGCHGFQAAAPSIAPMTCSTRRSTSQRHPNGYKQS
jgi:hypothetical protein